MKITLQQFIKIHDFVSSTGASKYFILEHEVKVNGEVEKRRGRKLMIGDIVSVDGVEFKVE